VLYEDNYSSFDETKFDNKEAFGSGVDGDKNNYYTKSYIKQSTDPKDPLNSVANVYGTGKTDTKYPYATTMSISQAALVDTLKSKTSLNSRTDDLICYETDLYLSSDLLTKIGSNCSYGISLGVTSRATGYNAYPMLFNSTIVSTGTKFKFLSYTEMVNTVEFEPDTWTNFKFIVDHKNGTVNYYINNVCVFYNLKILDQCWAFTNGGSYGISMWYKKSGASSVNDLIAADQVYFDNTKVYEMIRKAGITNVTSNAKTKTVEIEFNTPVASDELNKIYIADGNGEVLSAITNKVLSGNGYNATITLSSELISNHVYYINFRSGMKDINYQPIIVADNTYSYISAKSDSVYVVDGSISSIGGAAPTVSFKLNSYVDNAPAWIGVGFYDQYNSLVGVSCENVNITGETEKSYTIAGDCSAATRFGIFVWDNIDTMKPLQAAEFTPTN